MKFWPSCAPGKGVCGGTKILGSASLQPARNVCVSLSAFFSFRSETGLVLRPTVSDHVTGGSIAVACGQLEKKARELTQLQRQVVDLQCRLVEDRNQWQLEVSQLQRYLEDSQQSRLQQKESISQLLAEVELCTYLNYDYTYLHGFGTGG